MSTSAVSGVSLLQELQGFYQNRQADVKQLGSALQSGDLNGAEQAYNTLAALGRGGPFASSVPFSNSSRSQAFDAIGQALQSGDLAGAQAAFASLSGIQRNPDPAPQGPDPAVNLTGTSALTPVITINASSIYHQLQAYRQQRTVDLAQLGQDLQGGDLNSAQQDFSNLATLGQSGPNNGGQVYQRADRAQDLQTIGQALQSGDLAAAQSAFTTLAGTFGNQSAQAQTAISSYNSGATEVIINVGTAVGNAASGASSASNTSGATPEVIINLGGGTSTGVSSSSASGGTISGGTTTPELIVNLGQASGSAESGSAEEVTINLGSGSSGTQITIDGAPSQTGGTTSEVTINLNSQANKNYELILNLLSYNPASDAQSGSSNALSVSA